MEVLRLGTPYSTGFVPDGKLIEGYSSLIWAERFDSPGDFIMKTTFVDETLAALPLDTLITHQETDEVMVVETHSIDENEEGDEELTIVGRTLADVMAENRHIEGIYQKKRNLARQYPPAAAACVLLYNVFANSSNMDVTRVPIPTLGFGDGLPMTDFEWSPLDRVANLVITDSATEGASQRWWVTEGMMLPQLQDMLRRGRCGLRTIRPRLGSKGQVVTVDAWPLEERGKIVRTYDADIRQLRFDVYTGVDRSTGQSANDRVVLSKLDEGYHSPKYLMSRKGVKTVVEVLSTRRLGDVYRNGTEAAYSGLRRRVTTHDASTPQIPAAPQKPEEPRENATKAEKTKYRKDLDKYNDLNRAWKNERDRILTEFDADAKADAQNVLRATRPVSMFTADISENTPYKYGRDFYLGDTITCIGEHGFNQNMVVSEYVRTENEEGDRGLPGLIVA